jgi:hypothetical protein
MFFTQEFNDFDITKGIKNEWGSLFAFCEEINDIYSDIKFVGHGFLQKTQNEQFFDFLAGYIIGLNDKYYIILGEDSSPISENGWFKFKSVIEIDKDFLNSQVLSDPTSQYNIFESELLVELKHYQYQEEERIMISKKGIGNIDLYASFSVKNGGKLLNGKIYPAAATAAKNQLMTNMLNERFSSVKKGSESEEIQD